MAVRLSAPGFFQADVPKAVAFYARAFGLRPNYVDPSDRYAEFLTAGTLLCFFGGDAPGTAGILGRLCRTGRDGAMRLALVSDDLERDLERAFAAGAVLIDPPGRGGGTARTLRDPAGLLVELAAA